MRATQVASGRDDEAASDFHFVDNEHAIRGHFGASLVCIPSSFRRVAADASPSKDLLEHRAWGGARLSPGGHWLAALGASSKHESSCPENATSLFAAGETGRYSTFGPATAFDFFGGDTLVVERDDGMIRALDIASSEERWAAAVTGDRGWTSPPFAVRADHAELLTVTAKSAVIIAADGAKRYVDGWPDLTEKTFRAGVTVRYVGASSTAVVQANTFGSTSTYVVTTGDRPRLALAADDTWLATATEDGERFVLLSTDGEAEGMQVADVYDATATRRARIRGLVNPSGMQLSAKGDRLVVAGEVDGKRTLLTASTASDGSFLPFAHGNGGTDARFAGEGDRVVFLRTEGDSVSLLAASASEPAAKPIVIATVQSGSERPTFRLEPGPQPAAALLTPKGGSALLVSLDGSGSVTLPALDPDLALWSPSVFLSAGRSNGELVAVDRRASKTLAVAWPDAKTPPGRVYGGGVSPDGSVAFIALGSNAYSLDLKSLVEPTPSPVSDDTPSPDDDPSSTAGPGEKKVVTPAGQPGPRSAASSCGMGSAGAPTSFAALAGVAAIGLVLRRRRPRDQG